MIGLWPYLKAEPAKLMSCFEMKRDAVLCEPADRPTQKMCKKYHTQKNRLMDTTHEEAKGARKTAVHKRE